MSSAHPASRGFSASLQAWWNQTWLPELLLAVLTILAYQPVWEAGFVWDDDVYVTKNRLLTEPDGLRRIWFSLDSPSQYCPLVYTTFRAERTLWGLDPAGYHWVNLLFHAANAVLVWRLLLRLGVPGAWLGAAIFALHPVHVESVAWITERKNVLSLFFYLLAVLAWVEWVEKAPEKPWRSYLLALLFCALSLLSKTTACTLPAALVLVLWLKKKPIGWSRWAQILPFVAMGLGMGLLTMWWERYHQGTTGKLFAMGWLERILIASRAAWFYAGKLLWPANLTFSYPRWNIDPAAPLAYAWLLAGVGLALLVLAIRRFLGRGVETAAAFYLATLCPLLGFIMLYTFRYTFVADHYQYVASIGPLALAAAGLSVGLRAFGRYEATASVALCAVLLPALGVLTWRQCRMYADVETLWRTTIASNPGSYMAHNNLGTTLLRKGQTDAAIAEFQTVMALQPDYEVAYYNLGDALARTGRMDEALTRLEQAVGLAPDYAKAHHNLANILLRNGRGREALLHYEVALRLRQRSPDTASNLAWLLATCPDASLRDGKRAVELADSAVRLSGGRDPAFLATLAAAYAEAGQFPDAVATARRALDVVIAQHNSPLAEALARQIALYQSGTPFRDLAQGNGPAAATSR